VNGITEPHANVEITYTAVISCTAENTGHTTVEATTYWEITIDGSTVDSGSGYQSVPPGGFATLEVNHDYTWLTRPGSHTVGARGRISWGDGQTGCSGSLGVWVS
jgi:hypothetical protein